MVYLGILIKEIEDEHIETIGRETLADERTDIWWTVAMLSTVCTLIYGLILSRDLTNDLDYSTLYDQKDQKVFDFIVKDNEMYESFYHASAENERTGEIVERELAGYEIDQLLKKLGPDYINKQMN